jgi:hypothetical protein
MQTVSFLVTSQADVKKINEAITCYEKATGAVLNVCKIARVRGMYLGHFMRRNGHFLERENNYFRRETEEYGEVCTSQLDEIGALGTHTRETGV